MYLSRNLAISFKFRFVLAETLEALAKASNIVDIYISSFKGKLLFTP